MKYAVNKNPFLVILALVLIPLGILGLITEDNGEGLIGLVILTIIDIPLIWALFQSHHIIGEQELIMVFGPIRKRIPFRDISNVQYSYNLISSPAWTLKRLRIDTSHYKTFLMSTPQHSNDFKEQLQKKCPKAVIRL